MFDVVILAAGMGTRMKSALPKVLHPVAGRPMITEVLATASALSPQRIVTVVGHGAEQVKQAAAGGRGRFVLQEPQLGTGHAVRQARPQLAERPAREVLVLYGDTPLITATTLDLARERHRRAGAAVTLLSFMPDDPTGYGRIVRDGAGRVCAIVEHKDATDEQRAIQESNSGIMFFDGAWLWPALDDLELSPQGEYYLTDLVAQAVREGRPVQGVVVAQEEVMGINNRAQLAEASRVLWARRRQHWMLEGVTMLDPETVWLDADVQLAPDTTLHQNVILRGRTSIGAGCEIGPHVTLIDATLAADCVVVDARVEGSDLPRGSVVGPFEQIIQNERVAVSPPLSLQRTKE